MHYSAACGISLALPLGLGAQRQRISRVPGSSQASIQGHSSQLEGKQQWSNRNGFYIFMSQAFLTLVGEGTVQFNSLARLLLWKPFQTQKQAGAGQCLRVYVRLQCSIEYPGSSPSTDWFCQLQLGVTRPFSGGWRLFTRSAASGALAGMLGTLDALQWRLLWVWLEHSAVFAAQTQPLALSAGSHQLRAQWRCNRISQFPEFLGWGFVSGQGSWTLSRPTMGCRAQASPAQCQSCWKGCSRAGTLLWDELRSDTKREWICLFVFVYLI